MSENTEVLGTPPVENIEVAPVADVVITETPQEAVTEIIIEGNEVGVDATPTAELQYVGDIVKLAEAGDKEALIKRAVEIESGFKRVHDDREFVMQQMNDAKAWGDALERLANYEDGAIEDFVGLLSSKGVDPEILLGVKPKPAPKEDTKYQELESKLKAIEQEKKESQWLQANADKLLNAIKPLSKLDYKPEHLLKARAYLPKSGAVTPDKLLVAIHQANPELTIGLLTRQPSPATPTMGTSSGAGASMVTGEDMAKMSPAELRAWYKNNKGN